MTSKLLMSMLFRMWVNALDGKRSSGATETEKKLPWSATMAKRPNQSVRVLPRVDFHAPRVGRVVSIDEQGQAWVDFADNPSGRPVLARSALDAAAPPTAAPRMGSRFGIFIECRLRHSEARQQENSKRARSGPGTK